MISVALLSHWHVHSVDYAKEAADNPAISIVQVWDEDEARGMLWANELGIPFEKELSKVLSNTAIDGVIVTTPTNMHYQVIIEAAKHGKHIFTEKVLAFTGKECLEIYEHVEAANLQLMVSMPRLIEPYYLFAQQTLDQGYLGQLTSVRCRVAHDGVVSRPDKPNGWLPPYFLDAVPCGGGAMIDLGAYPIYLTNRLGGSAVAVTARLMPFLHYDADVNSVAIVEYETGAMGILETGFVSGRSPFLLELHGTEGTLLVEDGRIRINCPHYSVKEWVEPKELPNRLPTAMEQWVSAIEHNQTAAITKRDAVHLTLVNEAAALSHHTGRRVVLASL
jgi:scyllo-inositol 2-dehydrogenase (NAD+)